MAMRVDDHVGRFGVEMERIRLMFQKLFDELLEQKATLAYLLRAGKLQFTIIFDEHRIARRLEKEYRSIIHILVQERDIVLTEPRRLVEVALAEGRPATTFAARRELDLETGG